jgi:hypothetical protein
MVHFNAEYVPLEENKEKEVRFGVNVESIV